MAQAFHHDFQRFMMEYQFAVDEMLTKVSILREEFLYLHKYNPIEHVSSRVKTPESIMRKVSKRNIAPSLPIIRENISDIAGVRITCSFVKDIYKVLNTLTSQSDLKVIQIKDYIKNPKSNGYKSVHAIIEIPVFLSDGPVNVVVEVQIRTIAQDFWASLEHKIFYKYEGDVPAHLADELAEAAAIATTLTCECNGCIPKSMATMPTTTVPATLISTTRQSTISCRWPGNQARRSASPPGQKASSRPYGAPGNFLCSVTAVCPSRTTARIQKFPPTKVGFTRRILIHRVGISGHEAGHHPLKQLGTFMNPWDHDRVV